MIFMQVTAAEIVRKVNDFRHTIPYKYMAIPNQLITKKIVIDGSGIIFAYSNCLLKIQPQK